MASNTNPRLCIRGSSIFEEMEDLKEKLAIEVLVFLSFSPIFLHFLSGQTLLVEDFSRNEWLNLLSL